MLPSGLAYLFSQSAGRGYTPSMALKGRAGGRVRSTVFSIALMGLFTLLAILQFRWSGEASRADARRIKDNLRLAAFSAARDLEREVSILGDILYPLQSFSPESGERWFVGPSQTPVGVLYPGYTQADANADIGDSVITETAGIGGFAMAAAPAIVQFVGGRAGDALRFTQRMYGITLGESLAYKIPALDFRGTPSAIERTTNVVFRSRRTTFVAARSTLRPFLAHLSNDLGRGTWRFGGGFYQPRDRGFQRSTQRCQMTRQCCLQFTQPLHRRIATRCLFISQCTQFGAQRTGQQVHALAMLL